jgi:hypothetical protein
MTFDEFERATNGVLRERAKGCFERAAGEEQDLKARLLIEAQFYMQEMDRRHGSTTARRDFVLELIVIVLILGEFVLAIWGIAIALDEGASQAKLMAKQAYILEKLFTSTAATANTLQSLESTTAAMNEAVQHQLAINYDVSVNMLWDNPSKFMKLDNNGRTKIKWWGYSFGPKADFMEAAGRTIMPSGGSYTVDFRSYYKLVHDQIPKDRKGPTFQPILVFFTNDRGGEFVLRGQLLLTWDGDNIIVNTQTFSISEEPWRERHHWMAPPTPVP